MKKTLALLMSLAMMLTCFVGFALNSSAEEELAWVEETYTYQDALEEFGTHYEELEIDEAYGSYDSVEGFYLADVWTFEFWDPEIEGFETMTSYYKDKQEGWGFGSWSNIYTCFAEAPWTAASPYAYCGVINNGKSLHPGSTAGAVLTYVVPVSGTISYDVSVFAASDGNTAEKQPETWGSMVVVYKNDEQIWPAADDTSEINRVGYDLNPSATPLEISVASFKVEEGDKIRLCVTAYGGNKSSKRVDISSMPTVTYHEAVLPIGDPNGKPPVNIVTERVDDDTSTDVNVTWEAAKNAAGYNLYLGGEKITETPVTETSYTITGLESSTLYELTITTVMASGNESAPSDPQTFKTRKVEPKNEDEGKTSEDAGNAGEDTPATTDQNNAPIDNANNDGGFPIWIIIVAAAAVVVVAVVVVLVVVLGKKKKPAEAAPAEEAAPVEEAAPAEEEKKDEE